MLTDAERAIWSQCLEAAFQIVQGYRGEAPVGFDPTNTGVAIALGVVAAGATAYGAYSSSQAASDAQKANAASNAATNALNYRLFLESRGSTGSALLPMYLPTGTEAGLSQDTLANYLAMKSAAGTPADELARFQSAEQAMLPVQAQADTAVRDLFSGELARKQVANLAPVIAARGAVAKAQKVGILEGLQARLNALSANRARAGYQGGGSTFERAALTGATIPALQQAGTVGATADLANASDVAAIQNSALNTQLQNINLPAQSALNRLQLQQAPQSAQAAAQANRLALFNWFKLQPAAFQAAQGPWVTPVPNVGQIVGAGVGAGAGAAGNYLATQNLIKQVNAANQPKQFTLGDYLQSQNFQDEMLGTGASSNYLSTTVSPIV